MLIALVDLDFLLRSAQNCKKCTFLDNLRTIAQEGNMETRQRTPLVSSTSSALFVTFISEFVFISEFEFIPAVPPFDPFWSVKYLSFWAKATNSDS